LCERIAFIVKGRIVQVDTVADLLQPIQEKKAMLVTVSGAENDLCGKLATAFPDFAFQAVSARQIHIESKDAISIGPLVRFIEKQGIEVTEARQLRPSLEDIFVQVTGIELDAMRKEKERAGGRL
jgi:ABC-2 type transport system ATP-binding protein